MRILNFVHRLEVGGSQVNAIDLAVTLRDVHGHDVRIFGAPGPMCHLIAEKGLPYIEAPDAEDSIQAHPSPKRMRSLMDATREFECDLIHAWDWPQCLDAYYSSYLRRGIPMVVSHMSMDIDRLLPKEIYTTFGTPEFVDLARKAGRKKAALLVPPVDTDENAPAVVDTARFREKFSIKAPEVTVVTVSRVVKWMKAESLRRTIAAVGKLGKDFPVRFIMVGDGDARSEMEGLALKVNEQLGREAVTIAGPLIDPRPAYAAADIVVGMGGSGLRALAFGKPLIVTGENSFARLFEPDSAEEFFYRGIYGLGDGNVENPELFEALRSLIEGTIDRENLGRFGREWVEKKFGLKAVTKEFEALCHTALKDGPRRVRSVFDIGRTTAFVFSGKLLNPKVRKLLKKGLRVGK